MGNLSVKESVSLKNDAAGSFFIIIFCESTAVINLVFLQGMS
jgi:hypothetical protein